jgi:uncharacterized protein (TIGR02246 family)
MKGLLVSIVLLACLSLPAHAQHKQISLAEAKKQVNEISDRFTDGYDKHDAAALAGLFSPNAVMVLPSGANFKGSEAIKQAWANFFAGPGKNFTHESTVDDVRLLGPGGVWAIGHSTTMSEGKVVSKGHWAAAYRVKNGHLVADLLSVGADIPPPAKAAQK